MLRIIIFLSIFTICYANAQVPLVKTYSEWKNEKIKTIKNKISAIKVKIDSEKLKKQTNSKPDERIINYYEKLQQQEAWNLEIAQDLSVTDYLVLYVSTNPNQGKFKEAAVKMGPNEVAQLIESYIKSMGVQQIAIPTQAAEQK